MHIKYFYFRSLHCRGSINKKILSPNDLLYVHYIQNISHITVLLLCGYQMECMANYKNILFNKTADKVVFSNITLELLKRRKESDTYLATIRRQITMKIDKILELSASIVASIS